MPRNYFKLFSRFASMRLEGNKARRSVQFPLATQRDSLIMATRFVSATLDPASPKSSDQPLRQAAEFQVPDGPLLRRQSPMGGTLEYRRTVAGTLRVPQPAPGLAMRERPAKWHFAGWLKGVRRSWRSSSPRTPWRASRNRVPLQPSPPDARPLCTSRRQARNTTATAANIYATAKFQCRSAKRPASMNRARAAARRRFRDQTLSRAEYGTTRRMR
jgi:hypothetical protein